MTDNKRKTIAIIGGHLSPALAIKDELISRGYKNIIWIGTKHTQTGDESLSAEYKLITEEGIRFIELRAGKIWRKITINTLIPAIYNFILLPVGFLKAFYIIIRYSPEMIISFGGHIAVVMVIAGKIFGKKTITHEQASTAGSSNKTIAKFCDLVLLSWNKSSEYFPKEKTKIVGLPIRSEIIKLKSTSKVFDNNLPVLLVMGGNQGSNTINWRLLEILQSVLEMFNVIHLTGKSTLTRDHEKALSKKETLPENLKSRYLVFDSLFLKNSKFVDYLNSASLVLARSGANTVAELLSLGKMSILIPIPWSSNNEQFENAKLVENTGLGKIIKQTNDLKPETILESIKEAYELLKEKKSFSGKSIESSVEKASALIIPNSASRFVDEVEKLID